MKTYKVRVKLILYDYETITVEAEDNEQAAIEAMAMGDWQVESGPPDAIEIMEVEEAEG